MPETFPGVGTGCAVFPHIVRTDAEPIHRVVSRLYRLDPAPVSLYRRSPPRDRRRTGSRKRTYDSRRGGGANPGAKELHKSPPPLPGRTGIYAPSRRDTPPPRVDKNWSARDIGIRAAGERPDPFAPVDRLLTPPHSFPRRL